MDDAHALGIARRIVGNLNSVKRPLLDIAEPREPLYPADELYGIVPSDTRKPYDVREVIARLVDGSEFDEFKRLYGETLVTGFARLWGYPGRHRRQQRHPVFRERAQGRAFHRALRAARHSADLPPEHLRLHGRPQIRGGRHRQGRRQDGDGGRLRARAEIHGDHRRQLRRRQLRHVRPRLRSALPVDVAERAHFGDGRRAGRVGARDHPARQSRSCRQKLDADRTRRHSKRRSARNTRRRAIPITPARGFGTTA